MRSLNPLNRPSPVTIASPSPVLAGGLPEGSRNESIACSGGRSANGHNRPGAIGSRSRPQPRSSPRRPVAVEKGYLASSGSLLPRLAPVETATPVGVDKGRSLPHPQLVPPNVHRLQKRHTLPAAAGRLSQIGGRSPDQGRAVTGGRSPPPPRSSPRRPAAATTSAGYLASCAAARTSGRRSPDQGGRATARGPAPQWSGADLSSRGSRRCAPPCGEQSRRSEHQPARKPRDYLARLHRHPDGSDLLGLLVDRKRP